MDINIFRRKKKIVVPVLTEKKVKETPVRCQSCGNLIKYEDLKENLKVCPYCGYHFRMTISERINLIADSGTFSEMDTEIKAVDMLNFKSLLAYKESIKQAKKETGLDCAVITGKAKISGFNAAVGVFAFEFIGGSLGSATGEKLTRLTEYAKKHKLPLIIVFSSGGERIQEGIYSLMQVAKIIQAVDSFKKSGGLFIPILTNPSYCGAAAIAMTGSIIIAEKGSSISISGPRITKEVAKKNIPDKLKQAESLLQNGFLDIVVDRYLLKATITQFLKHYNRRTI
ncbi:MAG: acetyl-CoA carboxylase carboxyltransferase subunit beta [Caldisericota bacterium]|nr:acetyl-CoA carboxylase carboxyltransferase subunit beta [Caldisericota bacterium]